MAFVNYDTQIYSIEKSIKAAEYPEENKQVLFDYENHMFMDGLQKSTIKNHLHSMHCISRIIDKPFSEMSKRDIQNYIGYLERNVESENSKNTKKTQIKKFFKWYYGSETEIVSWINTNRKSKGRKLPEQLLTADEVKSMIDAADYVRDRALIAVLYDTGARISEIGNLKIRDVTFDQYGAVVKVDGKTGMRRIRIIFSVPYLSTWLDTHPKRTKQDSYLWVTLARQTKGEQLKYHSFYDVIKKVAKKAGVEKRIYNHLFRHSRATELAGYLTQAQMEEHLGWIHGSNMPQTYIHMSGKQVDDAILKMHGIIKEDDKGPELSAIQCPRCDGKNGPTSKFCNRCGAALDTKTSIDTDTNRDELMEKLMQFIAENPEIGKYLKDT